MERCAPVAGLVAAPRDALGGAHKEALHDGAPDGVCAGGAAARRPRRPVGALADTESRQLAVQLRADVQAPVQHTRVKPVLAAPRAGAHRAVLVQLPDVPARHVEQRDAVALVHSEWLPRRLQVLGARDGEDRLHRQQCREQGRLIDAPLLLSREQHRAQRRLERQPRHPHALWLRQLTV
eukprot:scaffold8982_cov125-Isochrysis_galbana.AAC.7